MFAPSQPSGPTTHLDHPVEIQFPARDSLACGNHGFAAGAAGFQISNGLGGFFEWLRLVDDGRDTRC